MLLWSADSTLALLMARVSTNHADDTLAADHLAIATHFLDRCRDFHGLLLDSLQTLASLVDRGERETQLLRQPDQMVMTAFEFNFNP
jgi:hypothetical protein